MQRLGFGWSAVGAQADGEAVEPCRHVGVVRAQRGLRDGKGSRPVRDGVFVASLRPFEEGDLGEQLRQSKITNMTRAYLCQCRHMGTEVDPPCPTLYGASWVCDWHRCLQNHNGGT